MRVVDVSAWFRKDGSIVTNPEGLTFGDETPEGDVADQSIPATDGDGEEDTWAEAARISQRRDWEANEADLVDQAIVAPLPEDGDDPD